MRSRVEPLMVALALGSAGCLGEGRPWGEVELAVGVGFEPPASRLDEAGRLKTANDFRVELEGLDVEIGAVELLAEVAGVAFDPSSPPPGYSLCHNGHCHADDGRLVPYDEIAAELAGGAGSEVVVGVEGGVFALEGVGRVTGMTACGEAAPCVVSSPVTVGLVRVGVPVLRVRGRVFEGRTSVQRVPVEGVPFEVSIATETTVATTGGWRFGPAERLGLSGVALVEVPASLFDGVSWEAMEAAEIEAAIADAWGESAGLAFEVRRHD
jgi:hypothetical protein